MLEQSIELTWLITLVLDLVEVSWKPLMLLTSEVPSSCSQPCYATLSVRFNITSNDSTTVNDLLTVECIWWYLVIKIKDRVYGKWKCKLLESWFYFCFSPELIHYCTVWQSIAVSCDHMVLSCITDIDDILPKGPYPPCLRMADNALLAGYPRFIGWQMFLVFSTFGSRWRYDIGTLSALQAFCDGEFVGHRLFSFRSSNAKLSCSNCCQFEPIVERAFDLVKTN